MLKYSFVSEREKTVSYIWIQILQMFINNSN